MSSANPSAIDYKALVQDDRIHASLYTDPRIFADEMDRIFHAGWCSSVTPDESFPPPDAPRVPPRC